MANTKNPILTPDDIEYWKRKINPKTGKPYTQREIADIHGVTPSYVSWIKRNKARSFSQTPREHVMEHYPWNVGATFHDAPQNKRMRDHAEYMWTGGDGMSEEKIQRLLWFWRKLEKEDLVIEFDPAIPPHEGNTFGGFAYRERQESDADLMVRRNEHTTITDEGLVLWRIPPEKPSLRA